MPATVQLSAPEHLPSLCRQRQDSPASLGGSLPNSTSPGITSTPLQKTSKHLQTEQVTEHAVCQTLTGTSPPPCSQSHQRTHPCSLTRPGARCQATACSRAASCPRSSCKHRSKTPHSTHTPGFVDGAASRKTTCFNKSVHAVHTANDSTQHR